MSTNPRLKRFETKPNKQYVIDKTMYLSEEERQQTLEILAKYPGRDATLLLTVLHTGARPQEVLNLLKSDLVGKDTVLINGLKNSNNREIPVPEELYRALKAITPDSEGFLFSVKYRQLVNLWETYRPVKKSLKSLRHTFAVRLYQETKNILLVQKALGHRSLTNTLVYAHLVDGQKQLKEGLGL